MKVKNVAKIAYCAMFPVLLFVLLERLNPASSAGLFSGGIPHIGIVLFSAAIIALLILGVYSLVGSVWISSTVVSVLLLVGYLVNYFKLGVTGGVFVPSDIFLMNAAFQVADPGVVRISFPLMLRVLLVLAVLVPLYFVKFKVVFRFRVIGLPLVVGIFVFFLGSGLAVNHVFPVLGMHRGTVTDRYRDTGFILGFYSDLIGPRRSPPIVFDSSTFLLASPDDFPEPEASVAPRVPQQAYPEMAIQPNVIVIMSESFMDPLTLPGVTFSQYPVSNLRRLGNEGISGNVVVPVFGGGTVNTEMEFLTGQPHAFFGSRFYVPAENMRRYFQREIPTALPWLFRENGYRTVGVHPFYGDFFNRNDIYPLIGFDQFIALEDMPDAPIWGEFVSDTYFTDRIIEQILEAEADETPLFLFGISMQNHWGFDPYKYGTLDLDVMAQSSYLPEEEVAILNSFLQGVFDADRELGRLADFIESRDTPTILVFFSDHLPILGHHSEDRIFERLGFISHQEDFHWTTEDRAMIFQTPYVVWASHDIEAQDWGSMSTFILGARVAELSGISLNRYFTYMLHFGGYFRAITNELYLGLDGVFHQGWVFRDEDYILAMEALWYANMFADDDFHYSLREVLE